MRVHVKVQVQGMVGVQVQVQKMMQAVAQMTVTMPLKAVQMAVKIQLVPVKGGPSFLSMVLSSQVAQR
jgi:hypothetical protein